MMKTFKVLELNKMFLSKVGIYSFNDPNTGTENEFFKSRIACYMTFVMFGVGVSLSVLGIIENSSSVELAIISGMTAAASLQGGGMFTTFGINLKKVQTIHIQIQKIVDKVDERDILNNYRDVEGKCQKYTKILMLHVLTTIMFVASLILSIYNICTGHVDTSEWILPFLIGAPFKTDKPWKWYILLLMQFNMDAAYSFSVSLITSHFVCCCLYLNGICDNLCRIFNSINGNVERYKNEQNPKKILKIRQRIQEELKEAVEMHTNLFELFKLVADLHSGSIFALLPPSVLLTACLLMYMENFSFSIVEFGMLFACAITIIWPFLFCYFASIVTSKFLTISHAAYDLNWADFPPQLQKYVILIIARSQEPIMFNGFGLIYCTLEIFGKIMKASTSYYLIFRGLSEK